MAKVFFWTRKKKFWQPRWDCFTEDREVTLKVPERKKINIHRYSFPQSVSVFEKKYCKSAIEYSAFFFRRKYAKTKYLWSFHFSLRIMFSICKRLIWQPFLFFPSKGLENFAQSKRTMKKFEKLEKTLFSEKIFAETLELVWTNALSLFWHRAQKFHPKIHKEKNKAPKKLLFLKMILLTV